MGSRENAWPSAHGRIRGPRLRPGRSRSRSALRGCCFPEIPAQPPSARIGDECEPGCPGSGTVMKFTKMHGIGNDYVYVETFTQSPPPDPARLAVTMSDRHFGVGSDGLILIMPSEVADARMRMFNADGSEGEMCGNGVRCVAKYLYDHGLARKDRVKVEPARGLLSLDLEAEGGKVRRVRVDMGAPILKDVEIPTLLSGEPPIDAPIRVDDRTLAATAVSMGNPHAVIYVDDVERFPLEILGPALEHHPM